MPIATEVGLSTEKLHQIAELVKRSSDEAVQLRIVERFLSEVERRLLKTLPVVFDIERVRTALQILKTITEEDQVEECLEAEFRLDQEFHLWRTLILERDRGIETYHFRRLCDSAPYPLDDEIYVALAAFYRGLDFSPATQSKFDLAVTRLFSRQGTADRRDVRGSRRERVQRIKELFETGTSRKRETGDVEQAVAAIDSFTDEANHLGAFEDLVRSNIFDRYRIFKRELGSLFFEAEIVAAAIECNITVGNIFNTLLRSADEQLSSRLTVDIDLPSALHDAAPESRTHISELFKVFFGESDEAADDHVDDIDYLGKLLSASHNPHHELEHEEKTEKQPSTVQDRLTPVFRTLTGARPDHDLIMQHMQRCESLNKVDINSFLYDKSSCPDIIGRRTLGLILWSVEFRESDLRQRTEMTESMQQEAAAIMHKAEDLSSSLKDQIKKAGEDDQIRLRVVLDALLDARSKLDRAIVRSTNKKGAESRSGTLPLMTSQARPEASTKGKRSRPLTKWLVMAIVLLLLVAGGLYLFDKDYYRGVLSSGSGYSQVDVHRFAGNKFILSAYQQNRTLFLNVSDEWIQLSVDERDKSLRAILADPQSTNCDVVVALDKTAKMAGISSRNGERPDKDPTTQTDNK